MKNILTNLMTSAVLVFSLGAGLQAQTINMHATVPFAWQAKGLHLNAGEYLITRNAASSLMLIQGKTNGKGTFLAVNPESDNDPAARLVFHRYGDRYFLAEVHAPGMTVNKLPVTRAEKEAAELASVGSAHPREIATVSVDVRRTVN
jgi:hypothetical protein